MSLQIGQSNAQTRVWALELPERPSAPRPGYADLADRCGISPLYVRTASGKTFYNYCRGSPVTLRDPNGMQGKAPEVVIDVPEKERTYSEYARPSEKERAEAFVRGEGEADVQFGAETIESARPRKPETKQVPEAEGPQEPRPTPEQLREKVPLLPFFIRDYAGGYGWNQTVRQQDLPPGAPVGLAELRALTGARGGLPVAQFSREYVPGTSIERLTLEAASAAAGVAGDLAAIGKARIVAGAAEEGLKVAEEVTKRGSTYGKGSAGAGQVTVLQTGGRTLRGSTANALNEATGLNLTRREWGRALEALKRNSFLPNNHHGRILSNGDYVDDAGEILGNLLDFLP